jgi:DNA-binding GntR family transcriptional regulator
VSIKKTGYRRAKKHFPSKTVGMQGKNSIPLTEKTYKALKKQIVDLRLRPGEVLLVQALAKEFGISRTPVREALVRLEREGFVEEGEGKKFRVSELTLSNVMEIMEIRELLEGHAVRKTAVDHTDAEITALRRCNRNMENALEAADADAFFENDLGFHAVIIRSCDNRTLNELMVRFNERIQRIRYLVLFSRNRLVETIDEHARILAGIEAKDPDAASAAMTAHIRKVKSSVELLVRESSAGIYGGNIVAAGFISPIHGPDDSDA